MRNCLKGFLMVHSQCSAQTFFPLMNERLAMTGSGKGEILTKGRKWWRNSSYSRKSAALSDGTDKDSYTVHLNTFNVMWVSVMETVIICALESAFEVLQMDTSSVKCTRGCLPATCRQRKFRADTGAATVGRKESNMLTETSDSHASLS